MKPLLWLVLLATLFACNSGAEESYTGTEIISVSETFKPESFEDDNRVEQIRSIIPEFHEQMAEYAEKESIPGLAYGIVVDDQLLMDSAIGFANLEKKIPSTTNSSFRIASMTKSFTAMAIMKLVEDGEVMLHAPVSNYIPEMKNIQHLTSDAPAITIENLLTMSAGFPEDNPWGDRQLHEPDTMLLNLMIARPSFSNIPSYTYEYSNTGYALLGKVISNVSGIPYQRYITEQLLQPLGMNETYWEYDQVPDDKLVIGYDPDSLTIAPMLHDGVYGAMGGLITSIRDFSKYVSFHLSAWPPRSEPDDGPVRRSSLRKMHQPQYVRLYSKSTDWNNEACPQLSGYGYGLGIIENCKRTKRISHGGALPGFGSNYSFYPDLGIGIMAFCNLTYTSPWPFDEIQKLLFEEIDLKPRTLPASDILIERQKEVAELIQTWDPALGEKVLAENFYLDKNREIRRNEADSLMAIVGNIQELTDIIPLNQLRGYFEMIGENDTLSVWFTLSPEPDPKVQYLNIW